MTWSAAREERTSMTDIGKSDEDANASAPTPADRLVACWPSARPFVVIGAVCIIAGGVVAAVTRPTGFELGPWLAAFLVLVGGVAQIALGAGQAWLAVRPPTRRRVASEVVAWNVGAALTVVGSAVAVPVLTTLGGIAVLYALALFLDVVRHGGTPGGSSVSRRLYTGVTAVVLVSTPIGLALAWIRHG
jgi:hypothetical protein